MTDRRAGFAYEGGDLPRTFSAPLSDARTLCMEYRKTMADFLNRALALLLDLGPFSLWVTARTTVNAIRREPHIGHLGSRRNLVINWKAAPSRNKLH